MAFLYLRAYDNDSYIHIDTTLFYLKSEIVVLLCFLERTQTLTPSTMYETDDVTITTVTSILVVTSIVGNSLVCAVIIRHRDMRYP